MAPCPPWSDLPLELLAIIAMFLGSNPIDIFCFRTICKSWFSSTSRPLLTLSPLFPLRSFLPPSSFHHHFFGAPFVFYVSAIYVIRPTDVPITSSSSTPKSWILFIDQLKSNKVSPRLPFSHWKSAMPLDFPQSINFLDFNVAELGRYYSISYVDDEGSQITAPPRCFNEIVKVVFCSNEFGMYVLFENGKLCFVNLRRENNVMNHQWEVIHDGKGFRFDDIINYKGRVLATDRRGRVYQLSYCSSLIQVIVTSACGGGGRRKRLIESLDLLNLVVWHGDRAGLKPGMDTFKVYVLNEQKSKWVQISNLNDQVFFLGIDFSLATSAQKLGVSAAMNSIIFCEHSFNRYDRRHGDDWLFPKSMLDDLRVGIFRFEVGARIRPIQSDPDCSNILWPPPTWIMTNRK